MATSTKVKNRTINIEVDTAMLKNQQPIDRWFVVGNKGRGEIRLMLAFKFTPFRDSERFDSIFSTTHCSVFDQSNAVASVFFVRQSRKNAVVDKSSVAAGSEQPLLVVNLDADLPSYRRSGRLNRSSSTCSDASREFIEKLLGEKSA